MLRNKSYFCSDSAVHLTTVGFILKKIYRELGPHKPLLWSSLGGIRCPVECILTKGRDPALSKGGSTLPRLLAGVTPRSGAIQSAEAGSGLGESPNECISERK